MAAHPRNLIALIGVFVESASTDEVEALPPSSPMKLIISLIGATSALPPLPLALVLGSVANLLLVFLGGGVVCALDSLGVDAVSLVSLVVVGCSVDFGPELVELFGSLLWLASVDDPDACVVLAGVVSELLLCSVLVFVVIGLEVVSGLLEVAADAVELGLKSDLSGISPRLTLPETVICAEELSPESVCVGSLVSVCVGPPSEPVSVCVGLPSEPLSVCVELPSDLKLVGLAPSVEVALVSLLVEFPSPEVGISVDDVLLEATSSQSAVASDHPTDLKFPGCVMLKVLPFAIVTVTVLV